MPQDKPQKKSKPPKARLKAKHKKPTLAEFMRSFQGRE